MTLTLELYPSGSDTIGNTGGDSFTEATNAKGFYTATVAEALSGDYRAVIKSGSSVIDNGWVYVLADDTNTYEVQATAPAAHVADAIWVEDIGSATGIVPNSSGGILSKLASMLQLNGMAYEFTEESLATALQALSSAVATVDTVVDAILAGQGVSVDATSPFTNGDNLSAFTNDTTTYAFTVSTDYTSGYSATLVIQEGDDESTVYDRIACSIASATSITAEFDYGTWTTTPTFTTGCNSKVATLKWFLVITTTATGDETTIASGGFYLHARGTTSA